MKSLFALLALLIAAPASAQEEGGTFLLSIVDIPLASHHQIRSFEIDSWDVEYLAVCQIPRGWRIQAGKSATPDGSLIGGGSHGATWIMRDSMAELNGLVLVRLSGPVRTTATETVPASFDGRASINTYEEELDVAIDARNIRLEPATHCPPPRR